MKFRLIVKLAELILGTVYSDEKPRADMYLPLRILALALVLTIAGIAAVVYAIITVSMIGVLIAAACFGLGIAACLCWKNQSIRILSDDAFEYTTFLGKKRVYLFSDIVGLKENSDSRTLLVGNEKVHIESCALMTDRLREKIEDLFSEVS